MDEQVVLYPGWTTSNAERLRAFTALLNETPLFFADPSTISGEWLINPARPADVLLDIALSFKFNPGVE